MSAPLATPATVTETAAPTPTPTPAAVVPAAEAVPTMESMLAALDVSPANTWNPPGEEESSTSEPTAQVNLTGEPEPEPAPPAVPVFELEVPTPPRLNAATGVKESGAIKPKFASQQEADTVKFHVKRSQQLDTLQQEVSELQSDRATIQFFDTKPVEGFAFLAETKPRAAAAFMSEYVAANPDVAIQALQAAGYNVTAAKDQEAIQARAELAQIKLRDRTNEARTAHEQSAAQSQYAAVAGGTIREVGVAAGLDIQSEDFGVFADAASRLINQRFPRGATRDELALALQPLAQRVMRMLGPNAEAASPAPSVRPSTPAPQVPSPQQFAANDARNARFGKLQAGPALASALAVDTGAKPGETLEQMITRLGA